MNLKADCRHFRNDKPCRFGCGCEGCRHYEPMGKRILIVKLDAIGDVARTTPLLEPLRRTYSPCHITWLVAPMAEDLLKGNPRVDVLLSYRAESLEALRIQKFDLVLSLDKTPRATAVATWANAPEKFGFGLSEYGTIFPFNPESEYALALGLDDDLKFRRNKKTYQEIVFACCKLPYRGEEYALDLPAEARAYAAEKLKQWATAEDETVIGLNLGGGSAFANKMWEPPKCIEFIRALNDALDCKVLLLGAERERERIERILAQAPDNVLSAGTDNTIRQFQALLGCCDAVVTGDSLGMHLAIAEKRPVVALFGPTCPQEIELYGRGERIVSPVDCAPCYRSCCKKSPTCMETIEPSAVVEAVRRLLTQDVSP